MNARVLDETTEPSIRRLIGRLLEESERVDLALSRVRLAALDLTAGEVAGPRACRVLLGRLDASTLLDAAPPPGESPPGAGGQVPERGHRAGLDSLQRLDAWIASGRLEVRSAGIGAWTPDFSVFSRTAGATCLLGAHYFGHPHLTVGPSITVVTDADPTRALLTGRFEELWDRAHDVAPAIADVLRRAMAEASDRSPAVGTRG
jgi:hypothetical protein